MLHPRPRFVLRTIPLALLSIFITLPALAEDLALKTTVVTATRNEAEIDKLSTTVTRISREEIDRRLPVDEADLFRDEPDVSMARDLRRHGATRVNIRGIDDNRVLQLVDGVRLPDYYNGGGPSNLTMNASPTAMPDFLRQVEIVRGPASSLYGSDALGGVVGYITLNPEDIAQGDKKEGVRLRGSYIGASNTFSGSVIGAMRTEMIDVLLGYGQATGEEAKNKGDNDSYGPARSKPNPANTDDRGAIAKLILRPTQGHKLTAMIEGRNQEASANIMRVSASLPRVTEFTSNDENQRVRSSLEYEHSPTGMFYDRLVARAFFQNSETFNASYQRRSDARYTAATGCSASSNAAPRANCGIDQTFSFEQKSVGFGLQLDSLFEIGSSHHFLTYGLDLMQTSVESMRDGKVRNLNTGAVTYGLAGETYPLRDFANGTTDTLGIFVQDEISFLNGRALLTPGLRYDQATLKPEVDALAAQALNSINRKAVEQTNSHLSPKLGMVWKFDEAFSTFGQIASGFRAPNYNEVNGAFRNSAQIYATSPNPELKPETSVGVELGLRAKTSTSRGQISIYDNRYKDFIENTRLSCPSDPNCVKVGATNYTTYMAQNVSNVRIYGAEMRGSWDFAKNWRLDGAIAYAHGTNEQTNQPLNSIEPTRLSAGIAYDVGRWGSEGRLRAASRKRDIDESKETWFHTPGYAVTDFSAWFKPTRDTRVVLAVNNLFDQKYWLWGDIRQADATNPVGVDFYSQPGRNLRLSFQADF
jgi:hemoglobin/transferrin/lactoferrin receptor protein